MKRKIVGIILFLISFLISFLLAEETIPNQVVVKFKKEFRPYIKIHSQDGIFYTGIKTCDKLNEYFLVNKIEGIKGRRDELFLKYGFDLLYLFHYEKEEKVSKVIKEYEKLGIFEYVLPHLRVPLDKIDTFVPNDPRYIYQWHLKKTDCPRAWMRTQGDTSVIIAPIDDGVDYNHEDLVDNMWINRLEDWNGNRRFDPYQIPGGDLDGIDNDGNGFVDDVIGYDFYFNDPDPNPVPYGDEHGTLCAGVASAVTNNEIGVASFGFKCRIMALKCGTGGGISIFPAITAIQYAAQNGAWAISMSWGGPSYYPPLNDAIQYAWEMGCVLSGSAGNTYSGGAPRYPACYPRVIATAASDPNDYRSVWGGGQESNYAWWVDVSAPGTNVYTTDLNNNYIGFDGTSASAPCVAGLAALLKAAFPQLTNAECTTMIFYSCDTMPDTLYRYRLLGFGRINVGKALSMREKSDLVLRRFRINDASGNNNGVPERGEIVGLIIQIRNSKFWQNASNVRCSLFTRNPYIEITKPIATVSQISAGDSVWLSSDSFSFRMRENAPSQVVEFEVKIMANPMPYIERPWKLKIVCGLPRIIVVDDDDRRDYQRFYLGAIDSIGALYRYWSIDTLGLPPQDTLNRYPVVIWFTGLDSINSLTESERTILTNYLNNGGNLFISGQNIGQNIGSTSFYENYLKARYVAPNANTYWIVGVSNDPIGGGDTVVAGGGGGANNARSNDVIQPISGSIATHFYKDQPNAYAGIKYEGNYRLVYFAFPFEAVDYIPTRYIQRPALLRRILLFFGETLPYGIEEEKERLTVNLKGEFKVYPNPTRNYFILSVENPFKGEIYLATIEGKIIQKIYEGYIKKQRSFNIKNLSSGIYYLILKEKGKIQSLRLLTVK
ncbi:MAG: S8 family serine peptidase [candidate division WOR-3 bacterium]|nr:S8 family serine peptidase [candidate division WOR-3 bacterium]MCX7836639.1 S8 family serine peptidase [candidate division WOR-3 bacterium]MDW8113313.1 S8 family serine peptidase [candidate division WOR-3 bacterium]